MGKSKALKFESKAHEFGWETKEFINELDGMRWTITVTRGDESLCCWWDDKSMLEAPIYRLGAYENRPRNLAAAMRVLEAKPDITKAYKRIKSGSTRQANPEPRGDALDGEGPEMGVVAGTVRYELPFSIETDPDSVILKELRGARLVYLNEISGAAEITSIPRDKNYDLEDTFYLTESSAGRAYVSFMDGLGMFRAVHLDSILQVG